MKKIIPIFLINLLTFYQIAFYIPVAYAQSITESPAPSPTQEPTPESVTPTPNPIPESTDAPAPTPETSSTPSSMLQVTATPTPEPRTTLTPNPNPMLEQPSNQTAASKRDVPEKKSQGKKQPAYVEGEVIVKFKKQAGITEKI